MFSFTNEMNERRAPHTTIYFKYFFFHHFYCFNTVPLFYAKMTRGRRKLNRWKMKRKNLLATFGGAGI